jgi:hypothetical protein
MWTAFVLFINFHWLPVPWVEERSAAINWGVGDVRKLQLMSAHSVDAKHIFVDHVLELPFLQ